MKTPEIMKLLHQRPPYLMVTEVIEIKEKEIKTIKRHDGLEAHFSGHFPDMPVVPGAMLQEFATQSAGLLITRNYSPIEEYDSSSPTGFALGVLSKVDRAKFLCPVSPKREIQAHVELLDHVENRFRFSAKVIQDEIICAKLNFTLVNLPETSLKT